MWYNKINKSLNGVTLRSKVKRRRRANGQATIRIVAEPELATSSHMSPVKPLAVTAVGGNKLPEELAVIVLRGLVMFPKISVPLLLNEEHAVKALDHAMRTNRMAIFVAQKDDANGALSAESLYGVGTVSKIIDIAKQPDGSVRILIEGLERARAEVKSVDPFFISKVAPFPVPQVIKTEKIEAQMYSAVNLFKEVVNMGASVPFDVLLVVMNLTDPWQLADLIALNIDFRTDEKQSILEAGTIEDKLQKVGNALNRQINVLRMARKIQADTGKELQKMEREMVLREQLKTIEKELGMINGKSESEDLRDKVEKAGMPEPVKLVALKELARMQGMPSFSPEISYVRTYLDWLITLPWSKRDQSTVDVKKARAILDEDHYGLPKVKERILEYLAVQKLVGKIKGPILCFVGPPGVGKTSIGKSIARSLGRKFARMSLGGVRDEAEIRGFRRTYVGSLPGRIIQGIQTAGSNNPVFMLDEIDKMGYDTMRGDPSAALLEALDPEQNNAFGDHYLEVPFDLSDVMFIVTANLLDPIPGPLRDRMEVIEFPGYTEDEKFHIALKYLIPKELKNHGISEKLLNITEPATRRVIREYTREAGVRNIERELAAICRKVAKEYAEGKKGLVTVGSTEVPKYLGPPRFHQLEAEKNDEVGLVTGLAWTQAGGEILFIESTKMPGSGRLILTGQLGQVMQESAQAAYSFARSRAKEFKIKDAFYKESDVHVHVPQGGIPKDGPSAGVAMATTLVSLLTKKPVRKDVAMTGEVTLRGRVMEIGGVKEKVLAAHRAGVKTVILPHDNEKDLEDVPDNVRKEIKFHFVNTMDEVLKIALKK